MDAREQRGLIIAATCRLNRQDDGTWLVPSQTNREAVAYRVNLEAKTCTCPDHVEGGFICKHFYAASIVHKRDVLPDGTVIETKTITLTEKKVYQQNWPCYNRAQAIEKRRVQVLLHDLCRNLPERERAESRRGPKPHLTRDAVFAMAFKVYSGLRARRFSSDLVEAHEKGYVTKPIPGAKVTAFFEDAYFTPILKVTPLKDRIKNKVDLLHGLKERGVWLVDASIAALYSQGVKPSPVQYKAIVERCWDNYIGDTIREAHPQHIICIGGGVWKALESRLSALDEQRVHKTYQPQARVSREEHMAAFQKYYDICTQRAE